MITNDQEAVKEIVVIEIVVIEARNVDAVTVIVKIVDTKRKMAAKSVDMKKMAVISIVGVVILDLLIADKYCFK